MAVHVAQSVGIVWVILVPCLCDKLVQTVTVSNKIDNGGHLSEGGHIWRSGVFCSGPLLKTVQLSRIYNHSKTFVDMPMKYSPGVILGKFENLPDRPDQEQVRQFVEENFYPPGSDIVDVVPDDWKASPNFLSGIKDASMLQWASDLNGLWKKLFKKTKPDVAANPEKYSLISVPYSFAVPGGRFREMFYW